MCNKKEAELLRESLDEEEITKGTILDVPKANGEGRADSQAVHEQGLTGNGD